MDVIAINRLVIASQSFSTYTSWKILKSSEARKRFNPPVPPLGHHNPPVP
ncbi:hypothetical protein MJO28_010158 [Puccinia striiformis f. sp. tritici]|nr:hypothetical protein MJO28_010158 [Puccinia striiformis f. sp. tritici]